MGVDRIPLPAKAAELNRVVFTMLRLEVDGVVASDVLYAALPRLAFAGSIVDHQASVAFASALGLLEMGGSMVWLTARARAFASLNPEETYELSRAQAEYLNEVCIADSVYAPVVRELFETGRIDTATGSFRLRDPAGAVSSELVIRLRGFMRDTGLLTISGSGIWTNPKAAVAVARLRASPLLSQEELTVLLWERQVQGAAAERWVEAYERERLRSLECEAEADAVQVISPIDVCAGYDVNSFDGRADPFEFTRFIEVKSTRVDDTAFLWSKNEIATARTLRARYWIYLLTNFRGASTPNLTLIQDPAAHVDRGTITLEPLSYRARWLAA